MSVLQALQETAGQSSQFPKFRQGKGGSKDQLKETEEMLMANPIPGQSLTQSPDSRMPYEKPSKFSDIQEFIDETFLRFTNEDGLPDLLDAMRSGLPIEYIAEKYLMKAFRDGDINPDMLLLCIEPTIYMLISLATYANIDPVLYPEDNMDDEEANKTHTDLYKKATKELLKDEENPEGDDGRLTVNDLQTPTNVPKSLLARAEDAVKTMGERK